MASAARSLRAPAFLNWRHRRWPRTSWARWSLRLAVAVPYLAVADLATNRLGPSAANAMLQRRAAALHWSSGQLAWVAHLYPPIPLLVARLCPGGAAGLAMAGGLCAGLLVQLTVERLILRSYRPLAAALMAASVAVLPVFWFVATRDFASLLTLSFLSVALTGLLDFTFNRSTESGFIAGIGFGLAALCDLAAVPFALAGALATMLLAPRTRAAREIARRRAAAAVVLFPTVAALAGWAFLEWRFVGSWTRSFTLAEPGLLRFPGGVAASLGRASAVAVGELAFAPLLVVAGTLLLARRPASFTAALALAGCVVAGGWLGAPLGAPATVTLLVVASLVFLPEQPSRAEQVLVWVGVAAQVAVGMAALRYGLAPVSHFLERLVSAAPR